jgi:23S rRNA (pseudouridine1915-N3)-methyltransferase
MRLVVAAVGRLKAGPERALVERYHDRAVKAGRALGFRSLDLVEIDESRAADSARRREEEAARLIDRVPQDAALVLLDETGQNLNTAAFADLIRRWRDDGRPAAAFLIGGPDGTAPALKQRAELALALGGLTWPHQLVRVMLLEQLYRVTTVLAGHPYHRD